jgi:hypothetical protein
LASSGSPLGAAVPLPDATDRPVARRPPAPRKETRHSNPGEMDPSLSVRYSLDVGLPPPVGLAHRDVERGGGDNSAVLRRLTHGVQRYRRLIRQAFVWRGAAVLPDYNPPQYVWMSHKCNILTSTCTVCFGLFGRNGRPETLLNPAAVQHQRAARGQVPSAKLTPSACCTCRGPSGRPQTEASGARECSSVPSVRLDAGVGRIDLMRANGGVSGPGAR